MSNDPLKEKIFPELDLDYGLVIDANILYSLQTIIEAAQVDQVSGFGNFYQGSVNADELNGNGNDDVILGMGGNDAINGQGGRDVLQGGSGSDTVLGQGGDDLLLYRLSDNLSGESDYYDGGGDSQDEEDSIWFILTYGEYDAYGAEVESYQNSLINNTGAHGIYYEFSSFNLTVDDIERAEIIRTNRAPTATEDVYTTDEDHSYLTGDVRDNDSDPDNLDELTVVATDTTGTIGTVTNHGDGTFSYNPNNQFEYLAVGETTPDSFTYTLSDLAGAKSTAVVTMSITGVNDTPIVATSDLIGAVTELVEPSGNITDSGTIAFSDVDLTDSHSISSITASPGALGALSASVTSDTTGTGSGGVISWSYSVAALAVEYLAKDQTKVENFTLTLDDGNGGLVERTVNVTITGTNDIPDVDVTDVLGEVTELTSDPLGDLTDSGTIAFSDVDSLDNHSISSITASPGALGSLTASVTTDTTGTGTGGVISWSYSVAALAVEYLAKDETKVESFTLTLDDGNGGTVDRAVDVTITGTNDVPIVTSDIEVEIEAWELETPIDESSLVISTVTELEMPIGFLTDSGVVSFTDIDLSDTHSIASITPSVGALGSLTATVSADSTGTGTGGVISWEYQVDAAAVEYLAEDETKGEVFTVTFADNKGGTVDFNVTTIILGTNDKPVVASTDVIGVITEALAPVGNLTDLGAILFSDVDLSDIHTISTTTSSPGALGTFSANVTSDTTGSGAEGVISWDYSVAAAAIEYLAKDQTRTESFTLTLDDGHGGSVERTVDVTLTGANDAPIVSNSGLTGEVTELGVALGNITDSGIITFTDVDLNDIHSIKSITPSTGALGSLTANVSADTTGNGTGGAISWQYSVLAEDVEYLNTNESKLESFIVTLDDGNGGTVDRTVDITIHGEDEVANTVTTTNNFQVSFSAVDQNMWGEGNAFILEDHRFIGIDSGFKVSGHADVGFYTNHLHVKGFLGKDSYWHKHYHEVLDITGALDFNIKTGLQSDLVINGGSVDAQAPFDVSVTSIFDKPNDVLTFQTSAILTGGAFQTYSPGATYNLDLIFNVNGSASASIDSIIGDTNLFNTSFSTNNTIDLLDFDSDQDLTTTIADPTGVLSLDVNFPSVDTTSNNNGGGDYSSSGASNNFVQLNADIDQAVAVLLLGGVNPFDLGFDVLGGSVYAGLELLDFDLNAGMNFLQNFDMSIDALAGTIVFTESGQTADFTFGTDLDIANASSNDVNGDGEIEYSITMDPMATLQNNTKLGFNVGWGLELLQAEAGIDTFLYDESIGFGPKYDVSSTYPLGSVDLFNSGAFDLDFAEQQSVSFVA